MSDTCLLEMKGITKYFPGTKALSEVSMSVRYGEIHSLVGENGAGKSTLMKIVGGVMSSDEGNMYFDGQMVNFKSPKDAEMAGIGLVHQELSLCPHMTVAENIFMGRLPKRKNKMIDFRKLYQDSQELLNMFEVSFKPKQIVEELSIAEQQVVELAKAISLECKLLILDEPTSALTKTESKALFEIINMLRDKNISILYISHRMEEIFEVSNRISVLRDGTYRGTVEKNESSENEIIKMMVGRDIKSKFPEKSNNLSRNEILKIENFSCGDYFKNISFSLYEGEILGFSGLVGAGRSEVLRAVCGIGKKTDGKVYLGGKEVNIKTYKKAIEMGIGYVTEDRKGEGLFLDQSIQDNMISAILNKIQKFTIINHLKVRKVSDHYVNSLEIKVSNLNNPVESLSGGNQQKVMIAKWLAINPKILILDEPTRGVDVGAKVEVYTLLRELVEKGIGVIIISSELPEIIGMCDRVAVMYEGKLTGIVEKKEIKEEKIMKLASGITN